MKPNLITANSFRVSNSLTPRISIPFPRPSNPLSNHFLSTTFHSSKPCRFFPICFSNPKQSSFINEASPDSTAELGAISNESLGEEELGRNLNVQVGNSIVPSYFQSSTKLSLSDQAFFLLSFIACTTSIAFTSLVVAAIPTLYAMGRAATSLSKLADVAREELPSTMAAIRLSGMEISDLTLELSDLSYQWKLRPVLLPCVIRATCHEIADGVNKSAQAVHAAEAGIRQIGTLAHQRTISMIQERASLPIISLQPVVAGAAKKTSDAVGQATKSFMNIFSRVEFSTDDEDDNEIERIDI
ncbi:uncharacterized protein LOC105647794 isoform X3 [Jatropha curcas]|uniref:uncharacterized protein LOC105647794 isoform X3 n=1 Tax=Jatropha curcas TaxID=180498 RepID=UPI0005FBFD15|nr:uncharacterized protein LOC105647794 isoform X3 [Jatropha curcas]